MIDWDKLRVFHAVAEAGSLTHAGEALGLSQSAVSRQISGLEEQLDVVLFHRHARGLVLTEQGEILFRTAQELSNRVSATEDLLRDSRDRPRGALCVTTTVGLGSWWLTPRLTEFAALYPEIELRLRLDDHDLDLSKREADVALRLHAAEQPDLIQRKLFSVHYHLYASTDYLARCPAPATREELDNHAIVTYGRDLPKELSGINWLATGTADLRQRTPALTVNSIIGILKAVELGAGIAALPDYICEDNDKLQKVLPDEELRPFDTYFVYPEELRNSKRVSVFRNFILAKAREWRG